MADQPTTNDFPERPPRHSVMLSAIIEQFGAPGASTNIAFVTYL